MTRLEEIWESFQKYKSVVETGNLSEGDYISGAEWADEHPRTDIIQKDSISYVRQILVSNFVKIAKKYDGCKISDIPEMKEAFDLINEFDKCCKSVGYMFNVNTGRYED